MRRTRNIARAPRGMTMLEILVALGIIALAMGSILTIFSAGARTGGRARERLEAGRVALAVFDLVDKGFTGGGRNATGSFTDGETSSGGLSTVLGADDFVAKSPVPLVWKYEITAAAADGIPLHRLSVTVAFDYDGNMQFDPTDRVVKVYEAILADRRVP